MDRFRTDLGQVLKLFRKGSGPIQGKLKAARFRGCSGKIQDKLWTVSGQV